MSDLQTSDMRQMRLKCQRFL